MHASFKALALLTIASVTTSAQGVGDKLRVYAPTGVIEGQVLRMDARALVLDEGGKDVTVARAQVDSIFRRRSNATEGAIGMGLFGATVGGFGAFIFTRVMCEGHTGCGRGDAARAFASGAIGGGVLGALTGTLIGSAIDQWVPVRGNPAYR